MYTDDEVPVPTGGSGAAGFLNTDGGTLLIGVGPDRAVAGLELDYPRVKPANGDGFVNWLTTHLTNALSHAAVMRTRARVAVHDGHEICRLDVARSSRPVWVRAATLDRVERQSYIADRRPSTQT